MLSLLMFFSTAMVSLAEEDLSLGNDVDQEELQQIADEYDIELEFEPSNNEVNATNDETSAINVSSTEELEELLEEFSMFVEQAEKHEHVEIALDENGDEVSILNSGSGVHVLTWHNIWVGFGTDWFGHRNIGFNYTYTTNRGVRSFSSVSNIDSWTTGFSPYISWIHSNEDHSFTSNYASLDTVNFTVNGRWVLGIALNGYPIGATRNGTWSRSATIRSDW